MPGGRKSGRGGARSGTVGKAYGNRLDLNGGKAPVLHATGGQYGSGVASARAQEAVPMGTPELAPSPGWDPSQGVPPTMPAAGSMGDLFADSTNPDEHVMNGAALGPGLGPEAMGIDPTAKLRQEDLASLAPWLPMIEGIVNRSGGSPITRQWLRSVYGAGGGTMPA